MVINGRKYLLGGRTSFIHTPSFACSVTTRRDGIFGRMATTISRTDGTTGLSGRDLCGQITYVRGLRNNDILDLHETVAAMIHQRGEKGERLGSALQSVIDAIRSEGYIGDAVNGALWSDAFPPGNDR